MEFEKPGFDFIFYSCFHDSLVTPVCAIKYDYMYGGGGGGGEHASRNSEAENLSEEVGGGGGGCFHYSLRLHLQAWPMSMSLG